MGEKLEDEKFRQFYLTYKQDDWNYLAPDKWQWKNHDNIW